MDRYKDHCVRSYHFSAIKRVNKTVEDEGFIIELSNESFNYTALVPGQRDQIVAMIKLAMEEAQISLRKNRGVNCPDNHNLRERREKTLTKNLRSKNSLNLVPVMQDEILPYKQLMVGTCRKKNRTVGSEDRFLMLGLSQILIARDPKFDHIVNVIPLEGSFCICRKENTGKKDTLTILTQQRFFELKFESANEAKKWQTAINLVLSKSIKLMKYKKRESEQEYNNAKINMDQAFVLGSRDIMQKIKEIIRHLADLGGLK